ncbi:hypothetical protein [uncultured Williamsia sp.]|uniref:hypothetical protein n=1 Tax=uncultured Williamsia sp. TaxID=259311 RepID=UPI0026056F52|nr:hypothetical protein [uncultured Williamsia sp.]
MVDSEFAQVRVAFDDTGRSTRLRLEDAKTGRVRFLDALELETLIWVADERIDALLDPSADRWNTRGD